MKKFLCFLLCMVACFGLFAQIADDGFLVPLDEDLTNAITVAASPAAAPTGKMANVLQGLWVEVTNKTGALIRDVATGEKKGYEIDNNHLMSDANWWFWGDINEYFHLDAEISVWSFDKTLFQANSFAANVPTVSVGDGLQSLTAMIFNPITSWSENGVGALNKMAFNLGTPFANIKIGYGGVKENGMAHFAGIYTVIDRWDDVGKGFTEITNGKAIQQFGDFSLYALAGFSCMRGTYGFYDILDMRYADKARFALTYGSITNQEQLFMYNKENSNAASAYISFSPSDFWQFEVHGLTSFNERYNFGLDTSALAGRITFSSEKWTISAMQSFAGETVNSVWGSDGQIYDDIGANTATSQLDIEWVARDFLTLGLDEGLVLNETKNLTEGLMTLRTQPYVDFDFAPLFEKDIVLSAYGVFNVDRLAFATNSLQEIIPYFEEAGVEVALVGVIPGFKKLLADYAVLLEYDAWKQGTSYDLAIHYHSIMMNVDITDNLNVHVGSIIRVKTVDDATFVPVGFALGFKTNNLPLPGKPSFWAHFCYGMNPYSDDNFSLYRADNSLNKAPHRTYLLNDLYKDYATSTFGLGLIWNL